MKTTPRRVKLSRAAGWRMPENTVKVDRSTKWGNPFVVGKSGVPDRRHACLLFKRFAASNADLCAAARSELRGKNLACWCPYLEPGGEDECHAAVLLVIANAA